MQTFIIYKPNIVLICSLASLSKRLPVLQPGSRTTVFDATASDKRIVKYVTINLIDKDDLSPGSKRRHSKNKNKKVSTWNTPHVVNDQLKDKLISELEVDNIYKSPRNWTEQQKFSLDILTGKYGNRIAVDKLPQTGFTRNTIETAVKSDLMINILEPTNEILEHTVFRGIFNGDDTKFGFIGNNKRMCKCSVPDSLYQNMSYAMCDGCDFYRKADCGYFYVTRGFRKAYGMTNSKFRVLYEGRARMGDCIGDIRDIVENVDIMLLDEFPNQFIQEPNGFYLMDAKFLIEEVENRQHKDIIDKPLLDRLEILINNLDLKSKNLDTNDEQNCIIHKNKEFVDSDGEFPSIRELNSKLGLKTFISMKEFEFKFKRFYSENRDEKFNRNKLKDLIKNITNCLSYEQIYIIQKHLKYGDRDYLKPYILPDVQHMYYDYMVPFLNDYKGIVITTGMFIPPLEHIVGKDKQPIFFPDYYNVHRLHLIIADTNKDYYGHGKFNDWPKRKKELLPFIVKLHQISNASMAIFSFNINMWKDMNRWREEELNWGRITEDVRVLLADSLWTYYRSVYSAGVRLQNKNKENYLFKVLVGVPESPLDSRRGAAILYKDRDPLMTENYIRDVEISDVFQNVIGRCIDPYGMTPSMSVVVGAKKDRVFDLISADKRPYVNIITPLTQGRLYDTIPLYMIYWHKYCAEKMPRKQPNIVGNSDIQDDLRRISEFIDIIRIIIDRDKNKESTSIRDISHLWQYKQDVDNSFNHIRDITLEYKDWFPPGIKTNTDGDWYVEDNNKYYHWLLLNTQRIYMTK